MRLRNSLKETLMGDFPGGPVVRICLAMQGTWVQSLVTKLRSLTPWSI